MFQGSITALVTPMRVDQSIDYDALRALVDWQLREGTSGLVIGGTTGESASLNKDEFEGLISSVVAQVGGKIPVIAGTGSADTAIAIGMSEQAARLGADAVLVVTPYYNRPPQRGMIAHFKAVAAATQLPVLLYNVPSRTGSDLLPQATAELSRVGNIVGIKEACTIPGRISELIGQCEPGFKVLSGDDPSCAESILDGACGVVSVTSNIIPGLMAQLCDVAATGDTEAVATLDARLQPVYAALFLESNPIPVKFALASMGRINETLRLPLTTLAEPFRVELVAALTEAKLQ